MSERERVYQLLDSVPDSKIAYIIGYIQGLMTDEASTPNAETLDKQNREHNLTGNYKG